MIKMEYIDRFFSSNLFLKIISVVMACMLWFYVAGDVSSEMVRSVHCSVDYVNVPAHTMLFNQDKEVVVQISGEKQLFTNPSFEKIACEADLSGLDVGKYKLAVKVTVPKNIKLVSVDPEKVGFELVKYIEKSLPVTIKVKDGIPEGLFLESVQIHPKEITIKGEESMVSSVKALRVEPTLEQLKNGGNLRLPVNVVSDGDETPDIDLGTGTVSLSAILAQGTPKVSLPVKVRLVGEPQPDFRVGTVIVEPAKVEIEGPSDILKQITEVVTPTYDISGISSDQQVVLPLEPLKDNRCKIVSDPSIMVTVKLKPFTVTKQFSGIPIRVEGRSIYPSWAVEPKFVAITVEGKPSDIDQLEGGDDILEAYVNVTNFVSRILTVPVKVRSGNKQIQVVSIMPSKVSVKADID